MKVPNITKKAIALILLLCSLANSNLLAQSFRKLEVSSLPEFTDKLNDQDLINCLNNCIAYFNRLDAGKWHSYVVDNRHVSIQDMVNSLQAFLNLYTTSGSISIFRQQLIDNFDIYAFLNGRMENKIRITTYYSPTIKAGYTQTDKYRYPVYGIPNDLIVFNKKDFVGKLSGNIIECQLIENKLLPYENGQKVLLDMKEDRWVWTGGKVTGRINNGRLVPYYSRKEIDVDKILEKNNSAIAIAWVSSLAELMNIHIQGSATLLFEDGSREAIFAMYTNSYPFNNYITAISKMKNLPANQKIVNEYLDNNPSEAPILLSENQRYIFFKIREKQSPDKGIKDIENMMPYRSIAVDTRYIPLGSVGILSGVKKVPDAAGQDVYAISTTFVTSQDIGGAIKGTHIDYFSGSDLSVTINDQQGEFYLLLLKK
jgi:membrane-bound lytic murein transglycosylase A